MATSPDDVRFQGKTGSSRPTTKMTRLTLNGHRHPQRYLTRPALWHLPSVEVRLYCRILIVGGVDATAGVHRTDRYGRVEFSATGICPDKNDHAVGRVFAAV